KSIDLNIHPQHATRLPAFLDTERQSDDDPIQAVAAESLSRRAKSFRIRLRLRHWFGDGDSLKYHKLHATSNVPDFPGQKLNSIAAVVSSAKSTACRV